jgi:hypothetical protein
MSKTVRRTVQKNSNSGTVLTGRTLTLGSHNPKITCFCPFNLFTKQDRGDLRWNTAVAFLQLTASLYRTARTSGSIQSIQSARLSFQSSQLGPSPARECCSSSLWVQGGRQTRLRGRGWGGPNSEEGTEDLVLYLYYNSSRDTRTNSANTQ